MNAAPPLSLLSAPPQPRLPGRGLTSCPPLAPPPGGRGPPPPTCQLAGPSCLSQVLKALDPDHLHMGNQAGTFNHVWRLTQTHRLPRRTFQRQSLQSTQTLPWLPGCLQPLVLPPCGVLPGFCTCKKRGQQGQCCGASGTGVRLTGAHGTPRFTVSFCA